MANADRVHLRHVGESWPGRGPHDGHTVTAIEAWPTKAHEHPEGGTYFSSGRVRCNCGVEWDTSVAPPADDRRTHLGVATNTALCVQAAGDPMPNSSPKVWGHWLTKDAEDVDCRDCIEWMHA